MLALLAIGGLCAASTTASADPVRAKRAADDLTPAQQCVKDGHPIPTVGPVPPAAARRATKSDPVAGYAYLDAGTPIVGGRVRLVDARGRTIHLRQANARTNRHGAFLVTAPEGPRPFAVLVSGGRADGRAFTGTLRTSVATYKKGHLRYVNAVTTLVEAYARAHPKTKAAVVDAKVKRALGIPPSANLTTDLLFTDRYFDAQKFLALVRRQGSVARTMRKLVVAAHGGLPVRFPGGSIPGETGYGELFAKWAGKQLANGAVSYLGGLGVGWVLGQIGVQDAVSAQLAQIQNALQEINSRLAQIQQQLTGLNAKADQQMLATLVISLRSAESAITGQSAEIQAVSDMAADKTTPKKTLEEQSCATLANIYPLTNGTLSYGFAPDLVNRAFFPEPGVVSLTQAFINVMKSGGERWFTPRSSAQVAKMVRYWQALEQTWLQIKMEWEHAVHPCTASAPSPTNCVALRWAGRYVSDATAQQNTLPLSVPETMFIDQNDGAGWVTGATVASRLTYPPPNSYFTTFGPPSGDWIGNRTSLQACADTQADISLCSAVRSSAPPFSTGNDWRPSRYDDIVGLFSGYREAGFSSPLDFLTDTEKGPGMSRAWLDQGSDRIWIYPCLGLCETMNLKTGIAEGFIPAGFLLTTGVPQSEPRYFSTNGSSRYQNGVPFVRYVALNGNDASDGPSACANYLTPCKTLAHAVDIAGAEDTIEVGAGTFAPPPPIEKDSSLTISGAGAGLTKIVGTGSTPPISIGHTGPVVGLTLGDLTVSGGASVGADVGIRGKLTIRDGAVSDSGAEGILNNGTVTLVRSLISGNHGYGINIQAGSTTVVNSTISANAFAGVAASKGTPTLVLVNATLAGNGIGAITSTDPAVPKITITNSLLAANDTAGYGVGDCLGPNQILSGPAGHNLIGKIGPCTFSAGSSLGNQVGTNDTPVDAKLGPLQLNGGPTNTMEQKSGSPAIGGGDAPSCAADPVSGMDQRGYTRPSGSCDIGAFDSKAQNLPPAG
jgi:hypothetical protein